MLSKTLQDGLADYAIGTRIRTLRLKKKIGLVELGKHTGLSPSVPHAYRRSGGRSCSAVVVTAR